MKFWLAVGGLVLAMSGQAEAACQTDELGFCVKPLVAHRERATYIGPRHGGLGIYFTAADGSQFQIHRRKHHCFYYARHKSLLIVVHYCIGENLKIKYRAANQTPFAFHWAG